MLSHSARKGKPMQGKMLAVGTCRLRAVAPPRVPGSWT